MMTRKVLSFDLGAEEAFCIWHCLDKQNPYWLYVQWYDNGWHKKLVSKYEDIRSVLAHILDYTYTKQW